MTITVESSAANPMVRGDKFAVTYHNVKVRELSVTELEDLAASSDNEAMDLVSVMDDIYPEDPASALLFKV